MTTAAPEAPDQQGKDETPVERMFRYSAWIHVGPGAQNCEDVNEDVTSPKNECTNPLHYHVWVRLPNQFQHDSIREKAMAAKGRRGRQLRDPGTDAHDALEESLDRAAQAGEAARAELVEELLDKDRWEDAATAIREVMDEDDPVSEDGAKLYAHIGDDQRRLEELERKAEDDPDIRQSDEYRELRAHLQAYAEKVQKAADAIIEPKREALNQLDLNTLIDQVREERIRRETNLHFMTVYSRHEWLMCTYTRPGGERRYQSFEALEDIAPEIYDALRETFDDLESSQNTGVTSGNS